jgi:hypothetical protein
MRETRLPVVQGDLFAGPSPFVTKASGWPREPVCELKIKR